MIDAGYFPGATYKWSTGAKSQQIPVKGTGNYWVEVTNKLGSSRDTVRIDVFVQPARTFSDSTVFTCVDEQVSLSVNYNANYSYLWNTGATTRSIVVSAAGLYTCVVSNGGCSIIDSVGVVNKPDVTGLITQSSSAFEAVLHPNPVTDKAILTLTSDTESKLTIRLLDLTGKLVMLEQVEMKQGESRIELVNRGWKGMYLLQLITEELTQVQSIIFETM